MSRKINFTISNIFSRNYNFEILIDGSTARCKAARFFQHEKDRVELFKKAEGSLVEVSEAWLAELDALEIFSWEKNYFNADILDGTQWYLTFEDGEKIYRGHGWNTAHKNWPRFMDWLGEIFKEDSMWLNI